jgi:hypothetical protein
MGLGKFVPARSPAVQATAVARINIKTTADTRVGEDKDIDELLQATRQLMSNLTQLESAEGEKLRGLLRFAWHNHGWNTPEHTLVLFLPISPQP